MVCVLYSSWGHYPAVGGGRSLARAERVNPSGRGTEQLRVKWNEPESVAFMSVKKSTTVCVYPYERDVGRIQAAAGCEDRAQSVPSTGIRWQWPQVPPPHNRARFRATVLLVTFCFFSVSL